MGTPPGVIPVCGYNPKFNPKKNTNNKNDSFINVFMACCLIKIRLFTKSIIDFIRW